MAKKFIPSISVIIPMYNAEKYIGECLDSILAQTFDDYEIIVVDDCSTDDSCKIVENYMNGEGQYKIQLVKLSENSGMPSTPRNRGLEISRGEYLFFMDDDDAVTDTAFEELYNVAKKFDADVVHCQKFFTAPGETVTTDKNLLKAISNERRDIIASPEWEPNDFAKRVINFSEHKIAWAPWQHFIKRDLLVKMNIEFPPLSISDDFLFSFFILCTAKKYLTVPNTIYIYRVRQNSTFHSVKTVEKIIHSHVRDFFVGMAHLDNFMEKFKFFKLFPDFKYKVFDFFMGNCGIERIVLQIYEQLPAYELDSLIRKELDSITDKTALTTYLFSRMNILTLKLIQQLEKKV